MDSFTKMVQPARRFRRATCRCTFRICKYPGEIAPCNCGRLWIARQRKIFGKNAPYRWRPISAKKAHKILLPKVRRTLSEFEGSL